MSTKRQYAREFALKAEYHIEVVELALKICVRKNRLRKDNTKKREVKPIIKHTKETSLALFLDTDCTKALWYKISGDSLARNAGIHRSYRFIRVGLQIALNKTGERLCESEALDWDDEDLTSLVLTVTAGSDVSSGHVNAQQKWADGDDITDAELSLPVTMFFLMRMESASGKYDWTNPQPQSPRFCRPSQLSFEKGTTGSILADYSKLRSEIDNLQPHSFCLSNGKWVIMTFRVFTTLYDGKCVNALVKNRCSSNCPMCYCSQAQVASKSINGEPFLGIENNSQFGMGVRVDQVRGGFGSSNTRNVARRRLADPENFSKALEIDETLVKEVSLILRLFRCKKDLRLDEVRRICYETHDYFFRVYEEAYVNSTLHKALIHGADIAGLFPLPVAFFSKDALRTWHKIFRRAMVYHARQCGRVERLTDLFNRGTHLSDPSISLISFRERKKPESHGITEDMAPYIEESDLVGIEFDRKAAVYDAGPDQCETEEEDNEEDVLSHSENDDGVTDDEAME
ncbi:hypothetical protein QAD02_008423 [Eretmocerus hayati]|uniref:Uncharacterized protein n=1 Tax=Eretmocerus hayati TaxID=131215 RepID=A0ACC2N7U4_9HYME|nr:hypothetical protein QAD02_008423 [Eretmocerus hayati]